MNKAKGLFVSLIWGAMTVTALQATAQTAMSQLVISGTSWSTNSAGVIVARAINNGTILRDLATANGTADYSTWGLAYHFRGNDLGDTIDVIDRNNGTVLKTIYGLYFGEDFGRTAILSGSHRQLKRLEYIYTDQNSHSLGSALLTDYFFFDSKGNTNNTVVLGQMQWVVTPDATHDRTQICTAHFTTVRPWKFRGK